MKLIKFAASWCQPCKMLSNVLNDMDNQLVKEMQSVDIDEQMETAMSYKVRGVPTLILTDDSGSEIRRKSGFMNEQQVLQFLNGE